MSTNSWRQREIEKARLRKEAAARAEEEARAKSIQKTETNFPSMVSTAPKASAPSWGTSFSSMAQQWATQEKVEKTMEEYRAQKAAKAARENAVHGVVLLPRRRRPVEEEYEEEAPQSTRPASEDDWTEVCHSKARVQREPTMAEMERMYRERGAPEDREEDEYNRELFEREY